MRAEHFQKPFTLRFTGTTEDNALGVRWIQIQTVTEGGEKPMVRKYVAMHLSTGLKIAGLAND
jgi:hypothetical protein